MTNKERAIEISNEFIEGSLKHGCYLGAMKMAEWKDQQFKAKKTEICSKIVELGVIEGRESILDEIINELFGEEEKVSTEDNDE